MQHNLSSISSKNVPLQGRVLHKYSHYIYDTLGTTFRQKAYDTTFRPVPYRDNKPHHDKTTKEAKKATLVLSASVLSLLWLISLGTTLLQSQMGTAILVSLFLA